MSSCVERLCKLFDELGIKTDEGYARAEINAYANGIGLVQSYIDNSTRQMFPDITYEDYTKYTPALGNLVVRFNSSSSVVFKYRMRCVWGGITKEEFERACRVACVSMTCQISDNTITFSNLRGVQLKSLGAFIKGYIPANFHTALDTNSSPFNQWDRKGLMWCIMDEWELPFEILDDLEV